MHTVCGYLMVPSKGVYHTYRYIELWPVAASVNKKDILSLRSPGRAQGSH